MVKTILLVEKDIRTAAEESRILEEAGFRSLVAVSGEKTLEIARNSDLDIDLALIAFHLNGELSGEETARRLLRVRDLPVVFILDRPAMEALERVQSITRFGYLVRHPGRFIFQPFVDLALELFHVRERMHLAEDRLRTLTHTMTDPICVKDTDGRFTSCNPAFERLMGVPETELTGKTDFDFFDRKTAETLRDQDRLALDLGRQVTGEEWAVFSGDSRGAFLELTKIPISDGSRRTAGIVCLYRDFTERKRREQTLEDREQRVGNLLAAVTQPCANPLDLGLRDIIDLPEFTSLMEDFSQLTGMATAILDLEGSVLMATGWQKICTNFHRKGARTAAFCRESDLYLAENLKAGEYVDYRCKNGLWDIVTPLYVESRHLGNVYAGQFFYDDDTVDEAYFETQARENDFDMEAYMDALRSVPRFSRAQVIHLMDFLIRLTGYILKLGSGNIRLAQALVGGKPFKKSFFHTAPSRKKHAGA